MKDTVFFAPQIAVVLTVLQFIPAVCTEDEFEYKVLPPVYNIGEPPATPVFYPPPQPLSPSISPEPIQPTPQPPPTPKPTQPTPQPSPTPELTVPTVKTSPTSKPTLPPTNPPATPHPPKTRRRKPHTTPLPTLPPASPKPQHPASVPARKHKPTRKSVVYKPVNNEEPKRYTFKYDVEEEGAQYTHSEASDGNSVSGFFRLRLPNNHHHDFTYVAG
ncbi:extensin-like [Penaeus monodon]|uniref:extensin-like n=1 Tax=Penaeus monodon TaxID=6687 RepID=UPI0018A71C94|nr:extensin-like [Penaeus monodon]